jgi:hypothetical protein
MNPSKFEEFTQQYTTTDLCRIYSMYSLNPVETTKEKCIELLQPYMVNPTVYNKLVRLHSKIPVCKIHKASQKVLTGYINISFRILNLVNYVFLKKFAYDPCRLLSSYIFNTDDFNDDEYTDILSEGPTGRYYSIHNIVEPSYKLIKDELRKNISVIDYSPSAEFMNNIKSEMEKYHQDILDTSSRIVPQLQIWASMLEYLTRTHTTPDSLILFTPSYMKFKIDKNMGYLTDFRKKIPTNFDDIEPKPVDKYINLYVNPLDTFKGERPYQNHRYICRYMLPKGTPCFMYPPGKYSTNIDAILAPHMAKVVAVHRIKIIEEDEDRPETMLQVLYTIIDIEIADFIDGLIPETHRVEITRYVQTIDPKTSLDVLIPE